MVNNKNISGILLWITLFSIAMAYLESSVVVYLRAIMYPGGFDFPLVPIEPRLAVTELFREAATIIMLLGAGILAGRTKAEKFGWFIYCFGVWDIFYYLFLKALLNWPDSLFTWDILFLIPVTWVGPVISPVIVAFTMVVFGLLIHRFTNQNWSTYINFREWTMLISGSLVLILAFIWEYSGFILKHYSLRDIWSLPSAEPLYDLSIQYIPERFNWPLFWFGEGLILMGIALFYWRNNNLNKT
ncbi:MAG: hypothetical protein ACLFUC_03080 [Bacteroidales bacterium]